MYQLIIIFASLVTCVFSAVVSRGLVPILDGRIVGGKYGTIEEFPYQVSCRYFGYHRCGGAIISSRIISTAAHCVDGVIVLRYRINAGTSLYNVIGELREVENLVKHPSYNPDTFNFDLAVIVLKSAYEFGDSIQPIDLPQKDEPILTRSLAIVTGWGTTQEYGIQSKVLQYVLVRIVNHAECVAAYENVSIVTSNMICASDAGKDSCQGDSGGPLVVNNTLVGVVSWGYGCARPKHPGVYANVCSLVSFIKQFIT